MKKCVYILLISVYATCSGVNAEELIFIEANTERGFHYPFFLFIPDSVESDTESFIVIEPNNSGFADDDFQKHLESSKKNANRDFYLGNYVARKLKYPLIVPVFPRRKSQWEIYTHALDRDVILQKENPLERIDLQLIEMFNDARSRLKEKQIETKDQFLLTGFSASGTFVNRFTLIHPDKVFAVAAGGVNGLLIIPKDSINNEALNYPIGTNDFKELFKKDFQKDLFKNTPQFYFMGQNDENDAIPYADGYDDNERELVYKLIGKEMQPKRWNHCQEIYRNLGVNATLKTYEGFGHEFPKNIKEEILQFFKQSIEEQE